MHELEARQMGLRDTLRSVVRLLKDPQSWTESHGVRMSQEYAEHIKAPDTPEKEADGAPAAPETKSSPSRDPNED